MGLAPARGGKRLRRILRWTAAALGVLLLGFLAFVLFWAPDLLSRTLGTGGYVPTTATQVPHPFSFDSPRFWYNDSDPRFWGVLILGPRTDNGVIFTNLDVDVAATAERDAEDPDRKTGGPYTSLDDFAARRLQSDGHVKVVSEGTADVAGIQARDVVYDYVSYESVPVPTKSVLCRTRSLFFEDRGYYYEISYTAAEAEYGRYSKVFERMLSSFHFLD